VTADGPDASADQPQTAGVQQRPHEEAATHPPVSVPGPPRTAPPSALLAWDGHRSVQVNVDPNGNNIVGDAANEPTISIDPSKPWRLVIGWRQFDSISSDFREAGYAWSRNAGYRWTFPGVLEQNFFRSDPVLGADAVGNFYYYSLTNVGGYSCQMFKSTDHGRTWVGPIQAYGGDKQWMDIDRTGGVGHGHIYAAWDYAGCCGNNWFTRSVDGGTTWMPPIPIPLQPIWGTVAVGPDGELYICGRANSSSSIWVVVRSDNAKYAGQAPVFNHSVQPNMGGTHRYYLGSGTPNPAGLHGNVWIAVNHTSGPNRGHVYMLSSLRPSGSTDPMDVHFIRSTDHGATWSTPTRVNDDPQGTDKWNWFGTMSVAPNGRIDVVWYDTRNGPDYRWSQVYYTYSSDEGVTWAPSVSLSASFNSTVGFPQQNKIGDYIQMLSDDVGASLAYSATFNGEEDIYFMRIGDDDCNGNGVADPQDIAAGTLTDLNGNGIGDQCEGLGDLNCDDRADFGDINPFVLALSDPAGYAVAYPDCYLINADIDGNGRVDFDDINPFVALLSGY
ncbi:MAG: sialidase family protein, partial [Planctomycetota bacterium]